MSDTTPVAPEPAPIRHAAKRPGWFERRRQRRRRRIIFEEVLGWLLVPFIVYFLYLGYQAVGGLPQPAKDAIRDVTSGILR